MSKRQRGQEMAEQQQITIGSVPGAVLVRMPILMPFTFEERVLFYFSRVSDYPFSPHFVSSYCEQFDTTPLTARLHMDEYLRFLALKAVLGDRARASMIVDCVWRSHLVSSFSYLSMCSRLLGNGEVALFLHYTDKDSEGSRGSSSSSSSSNSGGEQTRSTSYQLTLEAYTRSFGLPPPSVWPPSEDDSSSYFVSVTKEVRDKLTGKTHTNTTTMEG